MSTATGAPTASADTTANPPVATECAAADRDATATEALAVAALRATTATAAPKAGGRAHGWQLRFAVLSLIWGFSFLFIKVGTQGFAPLQVTLGRVGFGALVLLAVLAVKRERLPGPPAPGPI